MKTKLLIIIFGLLPFVMLQSQSLAEIENNLKSQLKWGFLKSFILSPSSNEFKIILSKNNTFTITSQYVGKKNCNINIIVSLDNEEPIISSPILEANKPFIMVFDCKKTGLYFIRADTKCKEDYNIICLINGDNTSNPPPPPPPIPVEALERINSKEMPNNSIDGVFFMVDETAIFKVETPNLEAFRNWVSGNMVIPNELLMAGISGKVIVQFVVDEEGNVTNVKILRGVTEKLDKMVIDLIKKSPKWEKPPRNSGKAVKQAFTIPVVVKLK